MRKTVKKIFSVWQFDKEEQWLNEMAAQGWHLISVKYPTYEFEQGEPGAYNIRLELLEYWPKHEESRQYISFVEDIGAEYIGSVLRWVYFRKKTADGAFVLYSDIDSRLKHLKRILSLMWIILFITLYNTVYYGVVFCANLFASNSMITAHLVWFGVFLLLSAVIGRGLLLVIRKKNQLCKERTLHE